MIPVRDAGRDPDILLIPVVPTDILHPLKHHSARQDDVHPVRRRMRVEVEVPRQVFVGESTLR